MDILRKAQIIFKMQVVIQIIKFHKIIIFQQLPKILPHPNRTGIYNSKLITVHRLLLINQKVNKILSKNKCKKIFFLEMTVAK